MTPEPLKGKMQSCRRFDCVDIESAVEGLIKFHEDRIEWFIYCLSCEKPDKNYDDECTEKRIANLLEKIKIEYESIMAIEHWLEDVI
jgi:hypothetical protein